MLYVINILEFDDANSDGLTGLFLVAHYVCLCFYLHTHTHKHTPSKIFINGVGCCDGCDSAYKLT